MPKIAVYLSDHDITATQHEALKQAGYAVYPIRSPHPGRWKSAQDILHAVFKQVGKPDIIIMSLPSEVLGGMLLAIVDFPVFQPDMLFDKEAQEWVWTGKWWLLRGTQYIRVPSLLP